MRPIADEPHVTVTAEPYPGSQTFAYLSLAAMSGERDERAPSLWDESEDVFLIFSNMPDKSAIMVYDQKGRRGSRRP